MALIKNDNVKKYISKDYESLEGMQLVLFGDWKDESLFIETYPEYLHTVDIPFLGDYITKRWIIIPKEKVLPLVRSLRDNLTEGAKIDVMDFSTLDLKTVKDFMDYALEPSRTDIDFAPVRQIVIDRGSSDGMKMINLRME